MICSFCLILFKIRKLPTETIEMNTTECLVKVETNQPSIFTSLFGILMRNNIGEINVNFKESGIEILEVDKTHCIIAQIVLNANKFNGYFCKKQCRVGVDVANLAKILENTEPGKDMTLFVEEQDSKIRFVFLIDNSVKIYIDTVDVYKDACVAPLIPPDWIGNYSVQMPSSDLQAIVTNLKSVGEVVKITVNDNMLQFYTKGKNGNQITHKIETKEDPNIKILNTSPTTETWVTEMNETIENEIAISVEIETTTKTTKTNEINMKLEKLFELMACSCLSSQVTLHLRNDYPLWLEYNVGSLGFIRLVLAPCA